MRVDSGLGQVSVGPFVKPVKKVGVVSKLLGENCPC